MSIRIMRGHWYIDIRPHGGQRIRKSTGLAATPENKPLAQEYHDKIKSELWSCVKLGQKTQKTWQQAVVQWVKEKQHKRSLRDDMCMFRWLDPHFKGMKLEELTRDVINTVLDIKQEEASVSRANRYAALIRAVLRKAEREWTDGGKPWLEHAPAVRMRQEPEHRIRWLSREQADMLMKELPQHLADAMLFTLNTGLRQSNVANLEWSQIDMARSVMWIYADQAKGHRPIGVPLNSVAMELLERRAKSNMQKSHVFEFKGKPIGRFNNHAWRKALHRCRIKDLRWHDLRHTWASWHVQNGTPLHVLQKMGGWRTPSMVQVYAHLGADHMAADAERIVANTPKLKVVR